MYRWLADAAGLIRPLGARRLHLVQESGRIAAVICQYPAPSEMLFITFPAI